MIRRTDARQHQRLRRPEHPARQHNRPPRAHLIPPALRADMHRRGAAILKSDPFAHRFGHHIQPPGCLGGLDIGARCRPAFARFLRDLIQADAFEFRAVEVVIARQLQRGRRLDELMRSGVRIPLVHHVQRTAGPVPRIPAAFVMFRPFEIGQDIVMRPSRRAQRCPIVIIPLAAADINHRIDRA